VISGIFAEHLPGKTRRWTGVRSSLRCFLRVFAAFGQGLASFGKFPGGLGKKSWKTTDQFRSIALASFQQFLATESHMPNEHYSSEAKDSTCW
jgi:hypothetical protein